MSRAERIAAKTALIWSQIDGQYDWSGETHLDEVGKAQELLKIDPGAALDDLRVLAANGSIASLHLLGRHYEHGLHLAKDLAKAERLLKRAAELGPDWHTHFLGHFYNDNGMSAEATRTYALAADRGYLPSMTLYAMRLAKVDGAQRDVSQAIRLLGDAAKAGSDHARIMLGGVLIRQWRNPLRLMRGIYLLGTSLPFAVELNDGKAFSDEKTRQEFRRSVATSIWVRIAAAIVFAGAIILTVRATSWFVLKLAAALDTPVWQVGLCVGAVVALIIGTGAALRTWLGDPPEEDIPAWRVKEHGQGKPPA